jgi:hypothetical protein
MNDGLNNTVAGKLGRGRGSQAMLKILDWTLSESLKFLRDSKQGRGKSRRSICIMKQ